jgi:hypothetical protein
MDAVQAMWVIGRVPQTDISRSSVIIGSAFLILRIFGQIDPLRPNLSITEVPKRGPGWFWT